VPPLMGPSMAMRARVLRVFRRQGQSISITFDRRILKRWAGCDGQEGSARFTNPPRFR
jgi:hypothetical protein